MTLDEFVRLLQRTRDHFDQWTLVLDTGHAAERRSTPRYKLRAILQQQDRRHVIFGPIGAVCFVRKGAVYLPEDWQYASEDLGLAPMTGAEITAAANDQTWEGGQGKRRPDERLQRLRARLIKAVGIPAEPRESGMISIGKG